MGRIVHHKQLHAFGCLTLYVLLIDLVLSVDFKIHHLCEPCDKVKSACPQLHVHCRTDRRPCGCCDECVGKFGDPCSASSVRCDKGLLCVNEEGKAIERVPWSLPRFQGTCQNVLVFPEVMENTDVFERRNTPYDD